MTFFCIIAFFTALSGPGASRVACADASGESIRSFRITNRDHAVRADAAVVIPLGADQDWVHSATVFASDHTEIPSQLDDLDGDGHPDELCFVLDLGPREFNIVKVRFSASKPVEERYPARVYARMHLKTKEGAVPRAEICSDKDDMYNKVLPHGPAFESELVAYRLYFDKKQTVDLYGKYDKGLELARTGWYPTDEQLAAGAGDDVIRVFNSVGVGTLKGWDPVRRQALHVEPMAQRCARIVATGPVRTVVQIAVKGWHYQDRMIDLTSRYILYAGHRDCEVQNTVCGGEGLTFCTGVMKMAEHTRYAKRGALATWGTDYPVNDTVKFGRQTVGLAINIDPKRIVESCDDKDNLLWLLSPDVRGRIDYRITFAARKEHFGYRSDREFYRYVARWVGETPMKIEKI